MPGDAEVNVELVREAQEALNRRDMSLALALCTDETVCRFPDPTCRGVAEIAAYFAAAFAAIPDRHMDIVALIGQGDEVLMRFHLTGTHAGPIADLPATGRALSIGGFEHFVMRERRVLSSFAVSDQLEVARQIGLVPPDGSGPDRAMKAAFRLRTKLARALGRSGEPASLASS